MTNSTRRLWLAILAWPAGIVAAVIWMIVSAPHAECPLGNVCSAALQPTGMNQIIQELALMFGPGIVATVNWWRGRRDAL